MSWTPPSVSSSPDAAGSLITGPNKIVSSNVGNPVESEISSSVPDSNQLERTVEVKKAIMNNVKPKCINYNQFQCKFCDKILANSYCLKDHERRHTGYRPYACDDCKKTFVTKHELQVHVYVHMGRNFYPYKCINCSLKFCAKSQLKAHNKKYKGECKQCPYTCRFPGCFKKFAKENSYIVHVFRKKHLKQNEN